MMNTFLNMMFTVFFFWVRPASSVANPRCIMKTMAAAITVQSIETVKKSKAPVRSTGFPSSSTELYDSARAWYCASDPSAGSSASAAGAVSAACSVGGASASSCPKAAEGRRGTAKQATAARARASMVVGCRLVILVGVVGLFLRSPMIRLGAAEHGKANPVPKDPDDRASPS